jgi:hypothetical protein
VEGFRVLGAVFIVLAALVLASLLGLGAAVAFAGAIGFAAGEPNPVAGVILVVLAVGVLVGGLRLAWRVGSVGLALLPVEQGFRWQVGDPGAHLRIFPGGGSSVWLPPGTEVVEVGERVGGSIFVSTPEGERGWLERREVRSGSGEGGGDG